MKQTAYQITYTRTIKKKVTVLGDYDKAEIEALKIAPKGYSISDIEKIADIERSRQKREQQKLELDKTKPIMSNSLRKKLLNTGEFTEKELDGL